MSHKTFLWLIVIFLLPALACGLGGGEEAAQSEPAEAEAPAPTATPSPVPVIEDVDAVEAAEPETETAGAETTPFSGVAGLDQLSSYRVDFSMDFDGVSGDQPAVGQIQMALETTKDPPARHLSMQMEGTTVESSGGTNRVEFYEVGDKIYLYSEAAQTGGQWITMDAGGPGAEAFTEGFFAPDEDLELPQTVQCAGGTETVNSVAALACTFTEADVETDQATYENLVGQVWLAEEGNYIVKYIMEAEGYRSLEAAQGGIFDFGSVRFEYDLTDINADLSITPPEEAASSPDTGGGADESSPAETGDGESADLPVMPDAENVLSVAGITSYTTPSDVATVVDFYRQELPAAGWSEDTAAAFIEDTTALLTFTQGETNLTLSITSEGDGQTNVNLIPQ